MSAPACLHHIALGGLDIPDTGPTPLYIDDDNRNFHYRCGPDRLLHQANPRSTRRGHRFHTAQGGPCCSGDASDLIFHLNKATLDLG